MKVGYFLLAGVVVLGATSCAAVGSAPPSPRPETPGSSGVQELPSPEDPHSLQPGEGSPANEQVSHAASELSGALQDDDRLASVEVIGGKKIVVHWDGPVDSRLQSLLGRFPDVEIAVETTACSPGEVRAKGEELFRSDPAIKAFALTPDGSSVELLLDPSLESKGDTDSLERTYTEALGCPVRVEFGTVTPA